MKQSNRRSEVRKARVQNEDRFVLFLFALCRFASTIKYLALATGLIKQSLPFVVLIEHSASSPRFRASFPFFKAIVQSPLRFFVTKLSGNYFPRHNIKLHGRPQALFSAEAAINATMAYPLSCHTQTALRRSIRRHRHHNTRSKQRFAKLLSLVLFSTAHVCRRSAFSFATTV